jgi:sigma-B regulation protein RsbU (phosphoserine phosphatase)
MAAAQTLLRASLMHLKPLTVAVEELNREVAIRAPIGEFISLFVGIIDRQAGTMEFVDAGHGYWLHRGTQGKAERVKYEGGLVLGVDPEQVYHSETVKLSPGDRIVIFSDGVVEQHSPTGEQFGFESVYATLEGSSGEEEDVRVLLDGLQSFAQSDDLSDDVTIASVRFDP